MKRRKWSEWKDKVLENDPQLEEIANHIKAASPVPYRSILRWYKTLDVGAPNWDEGMYRTALSSPLDLLDQFGATKCDEEGVITWIGK